MFKLYYNPATIAPASLITLAESGAEYEPVELDFSKNEQLDDEYLRINPKGRVPALVTDEGILTETPAILFYIAQLFPQSQLAPLDDPFALAQVQSFNSYLCSTVHINHAHMRRGYRWADQQSSYDDMIKKVPETMGEAFDLINNEFLKGPWVMGEQYSICDPYLFTISRWLAGDGVAADRHPAVQQHMQRMIERPAVAKVMDLIGS